MITKEDIQELITAGLETSFIEVRGDDGQHFEATIVSPAFDGLNMVKQHQLVYTTLGDRIQTGVIHALALKTYTPAEWDKQ
jgi:acid stress-induced BolA-like protein IbaG/YrbA